MKAVLTQNLGGGHIHISPIASVPGRTLNSVTALRWFLHKHAADCFGPKEGRDWRIANRPGELIPIYAVSAQGDTITIE